MTHAPIQMPELKPCPFEENQRWENPDGLCMTICSVKDGYVHYLTDQGNFGKETIQHMKEWLENETITEARAL